MVTQQQTQALSRSDILQRLQSIKPQQWVLYYCSHYTPQLSLSEYDAQVVCETAMALTKSDHVMLFQKKSDHRYFYYARGVNPKTKKIIEYAALMSSFPAKKSVRD